MQNFMSKICLHILRFKDFAFYGSHSSQHFEPQSTSSDDIPSTKLWKKFRSANPFTFFHPLRMDRDGTFPECFEESVVGADGRAERRIANVVNRIILAGLLHDSADCRVMNMAYF